MYAMELKDSKISTNKYACLCLFVVQKVISTLIFQLSLIIYLCPSCSDIAVNLDYKKRMDHYRIKVTT
jgi:hypothetical protein